MAAAVQRDIFVEGFSGANTADIVYEWQLLLQNSDGSPMDLDGATTSFKAKKSYSDANAVITASEISGITVDANNSIATLALTVGHFAGVALNRESTEFVYDWDLVVDGRRFRMYRGSMTVGGDI